MDEEENFQFVKSIEEYKTVAEIEYARNILDKSLEYTPADGIKVGFYFVYATIYSIQSEIIRNTN